MIRAGCPMGRSNIQLRLLQIVTQTLSCNGLHVLMNHAALQQFPDKQSHTASPLKGVDITGAVGVNTHDQGYHVREI